MKNPQNHSIKPQSFTNGLVLDQVSIDLKDAIMNAANRTLLQDKIKTEYLFGRDGCSFEELPELLIRNHKRPFITQAIGDSMAPEIKDGDKVVVESISHARHNDIILASLNGTKLLKVYFTNSDGAYLKSINSGHSPIKINDYDDFQVIGKVTAVYRSVESIMLSKHLYD